MINLTPYIRSLDNKTFAVFGLARSGLSTVRALVEGGATVIAYDDRDSAQDAARKMGARISPMDVDTLKDCEAVILSPGVPLTHPDPHAVVKAAHAAGVAIISDIELLYRTLPDATYIGITGTNGKSTTTALVHHILAHIGYDSQCGGNIGVPVMDLDVPRGDGAFVLELSSYQLDLCDTFTADIAVLLNITPDHIDRHGDMAGYTKSKMRIFKGAAYTIKPDDLHIYKSALTVNDRLGDDFPTLAGVHNLENAAAALAICRRMGAPDDAIIDAMKYFGGLAHRQFLVREINGVKYINDSKATNAVAAITALSSYNDIIWIAGGREKDGGLEGTQDLLPRVRHAFLIGEAADNFSAFLTKQNVAYTICGTLSQSLKAAHTLAQATINEPSTPVVLLSPACSSFDQFPSYEHRGDAFVAEVRAL